MSDRPRSSGLRLWLVAAAALVVGIVIGFNSGYDAGRRASATGVTSGGDPPAAPRAAAPAAVPQAFTEGAVTPPAGPSAPAAAVVPDEPVHRVDVPAVSAVRRESEPPRQQAAPQVEPRPAPPRAAEAAPRTSRAEPRPSAADRATTGPGSLQVVSRPSGAQVVLDGRVVGRTPLVLSDVPPGAHAVRLELPGFQRWATSIEVTPGTQTRVAASLEQ